MRRRSPRSLKQFIASYVLDPAAHLAEPVRFEVLRHAKPDEIGYIQSQFDNLPTLETPSDIWSRAAKLGQKCRAQGYTANSLDLLIAEIAVAHDALLITFDEGYNDLQRHGKVRARILRRP